jgi:hypothetical protein
MKTFEISTATDVYLLPGDTIEVNDAVFVIVAVNKKSYRMAYEVREMTWYERLKFNVRYICSKWHPFEPAFLWFATITSLFGYRTANGFQKSEILALGGSIALGFTLHFAARRIEDYLVEPKPPESADRPFRGLSPRTWGGICVGLCYPIGASLKQGVRTRVLIANTVTFLLGVFVLDLLLLRRRRRASARTP